MSSPIPISSIPTISHLYQTGKLLPPPHLSTSFASSSALNAKISLIRADITKLATTCIVNAANTSLLGGGGVDGAIHSAAGPGLYDECLPLNGCATGSAKITSAHALPSKHVIHAVGPIYAKAKREGGDNKPRELLEGCYQTSLNLAARVGELRGGKRQEGKDEDEISIAFSCLSTGAYGYPSNEAARVACRAVRDWLQQQVSKGEKGQVGRVIFCCFLEKDVSAYEEWLPKIFPPTDSDLQPNSSPELQETAEKEGSAAISTGNTQTLANTSLTTGPTPKKQRTASPPHQAHTSTSNDDDKDWEAVEKPQASLASSTMDSTTSASEIDPAASTDSVPLGESTVDVDVGTAAAAAKAELESRTSVSRGEKAEMLDGGLDDEEGVEVEKPRDLEEDEGVEVERPKGENLLGKDW